MSLHFEITDAASAQIAKLINNEPAGSRLRIEVLGGGCSGFQYKYTFDAAKNDDDLTFTKSNAEVIIDETSLSLISGATIDFEEDLGSASFVIKNPNAKAKCGCGNSFSV